MKSLLLRWLALAIAIVIVGYISSALGLGFRSEVQTEKTLEYGIRDVFLGAALLALVNATLGNILKLLTLPLNCLTLGLFSLVVNTGMLLLVANQGIGLMVQGEGTGRFLSAFVASLMISAVNGLVGGILLPDKKD